MNEYEKHEYLIQRFAGAFIGNCLEKIPTYFSEWVNTIDIKGTIPKPGFIKLFKPNIDCYLCFNYTNVLEEVYGLKNVCHIHGKQHEKIIFGHGFELSYRSEFLLREDLECGLLESYMDLKKEPEKQIKLNIDFFNNIYNLKEIFSFGFSFSKPDTPYINEICKKTTKDTIWYFNNFEDKITIKEYQELVYNNGFKGKVDTFTVV